MKVIIKELYSKIEVLTQEKFAAEKMAAVVEAKYEQIGEQIKKNGL